MPNPNPSKKTRFTTERDEALTDNMSIRMPPSVMNKLKKKDNWREFVRITLAKALEEEQEQQDFKSA
ncbi:MAG: hypothetical protein QNJ38_17580 [Prochloraceae cyanobacterium]|nr:hypothetical protein [Prochloraceae cyanobacterium]